MREKNKMAELQHVYELRKAGKLHLLKIHMDAILTIGWFFFGRQVQYPSADLFVGMVCKKQIWLKQ